MFETYLFSSKNDIIFSGNIRGGMTDERNKMSQLWNRIPNQ